MELSRPSFGINIDFIAAADRRLSIQAVRQRILNLLQESSAAACRLSECTVHHRFRPPVSPRKYDGGFWSVSEQRQEQPRVAEQGFTADGACPTFRLHRLTIASPTRERWTAEIDVTASGHGPCVLPHNQVAYAIKQLDSVNHEPKNGIRAIYTDNLCTTDVFVGSGNHDRRFAYQTLKDVLKVFVLFEGILDSIALDASHIRHGLFNALAAERAIYLAQDHLTLAGICQSLPMAYSAVDVSTSARSGGRHALKFRQRSASLEVEEIMAWVNTCVGIVAWIESSTYGTVFGYCSNKWYDLHHSLPQLLVDIGADPAAAEHYTKVLADGAANTYEQLIYEQSVARAEGHIARDVLMNAARARYLRANRNTVGMAVLEKILQGHYGWLPSGSPLTYAGFPVVGAHYGDVTAVPENEAPPREDASDVLANVLAIKRIPKSISREELLAMMAEIGLPSSSRLTYLYSGRMAIGTAFADFTDPADALVVMNALNGGRIKGVSLVAEYKRLEPRVDRNRRYREERNRRVWSVGSSSTEPETACMGNSEETGQCSTAEAERADSVVDEEDEFHSCLSWQSSAEEHSEGR